MKAMRKIMASLLAVTMAASAGIGALADGKKIESTAEGENSATVPVTIAAAQATTFSVKVPSSLPLTIKADGSVEVPTNLQIENDSAGPVKVTKIEAKKRAWSLAKFNSDFDAMAVNAEKLGFKLNDATTIDSAESTQTLANFDASKWTIGGNKKLPITVDANASAVSAAVENASAASVVFTIAWDYADGTEATTPPAQTSAPTMHTMTFNMNGGGEAVTKQVASGNKVEKPTDPSRDGYTFEGWYKESTCETGFDFDATINAETTLYAKWTEAQDISFTIDGTTYYAKAGMTWAEWAAEWAADTHYNKSGYRVYLDTTKYFAKCDNGRDRAIEYCIDENTYIPGGEAILPLSVFTKYICTPNNNLCGSRQRIEDGWAYLIRSTIDYLDELQVRISGDLKASQVLYALMTFPVWENVNDDYVDAEETINNILSECGCRNISELIEAEDKGEITAKAKNINCIHYDELDYVYARYIL